jgi:hypothetical protein
MRKERLLMLIEKEWQNFLKSFEDLPDNALQETDVVGIWSIRDVLAHISTWEEESLKNIPLILEGKSTPRYTGAGGIDAFNAREQAKKKALTLAEVKISLKSTHDRLVQFLSWIPDSDYISNARLIHRIRLDTCNHYREHADQIEEWREQNGR